MFLVTLSVSNHCVLLNKLRKRRPQIARKTWAALQSSGILKRRPAAAPCTGTLHRHQQPSSKAQAQTAPWQQRLAPLPCSGTLQRHQQPTSKATKLQSANKFLAAPLQRHQEPSSKAKTALWQQHLAAGGTSNKAPKTLTAAPCSGTLQRHPAATPCSSTLQQHEQRSSKAQAVFWQRLAEAPGTKLQSANGTLTAAPRSGRYKQQNSKAQPALWQQCLSAALCRGTLRQHQQPSSKAQTALWQHHLAAAPCNGTNNRTPKHKHFWWQDLAAAPCSRTSTQTPRNSSSTWTKKPKGFTASL